MPRAADFPVILTAPDDGARKRRKNMTNKSNYTSPRFLIVGFDGLRPDCVTNVDMPALRAFLDSHREWTNYLSTFPTETYVNHPSIFSGGRPNEHGIIANAFFRRGKKGEDAVFVGSRVKSVESLGVEGLFTLPSLGERLARAGHTLRVYCANSAGSTRLQHHDAGKFPGHLNLCVHDFSTIVPEEEGRAIAERFEAVPLKFPDFDGNALLTKLFFEYELPRGLGDVTVLWYGEPDHSSHEFGLWDERTCAARKSADDEFAKVLDWWEREGRAAGVQLVVMSDHGHGVVVRHADLLEPLRKAGFTVLRGEDVLHGADPESADVVAVGTYAVGLWFKDASQANLVRARDALMASPDTGLVFSQPVSKGSTDVEGLVPGTLSEALVFSDHVRGPDLRVVGRGDPEKGTLVMMEELPLHAGNHGGLLPQEVKCLLGAAGTMFPGAARHDEPAGHDDLAVTIMMSLHLLDDEAQLPLPKGGFLKEAVGEVAEKAADAERAVTETITLSCGDFTQYLKRRDYAGHRYVLEGGRVA